MSGKIKVEVFGIKDQQLGCGCSCGGNCGPSKTMGESYDELIDFLNHSDVKDKVESNFIDVLMDNLDGYESVTSAMEHGFTLPLTSIGEELKFYGGISNEMIYDEIKKLL